MSALVVDDEEEQKCARSVASIGKGVATESNERVRSMCALLGEHASGGNREWRGGRCQGDRPHVQSVEVRAMNAKVMFIQA